VNSVDYARLAARSYSDEPTVGQADSASRMHVYGDVHVFRGSDDLASWVHDFDVALVDVPGLGKLHAGFWAAWQAIRSECLALPAPSAIAGHSLGGALAIIAAEWALLGHVVPVYAFEPPRVAGDDTLTHVYRDFAIPFYGTRNGNDLVTQVPPELSCPRVLTCIGKPSMPFDNLSDHSIERVIEALK
jgi:triacylglycerol lipase